MATWRIGIDEHGMFNALDPNDDSFVCAVITQKSDWEILDVFKKIYRTVNGENVVIPVIEEELLNFFHGSKQKKEKRSKIFKEILRESDSLFCRVVQCKEKPIIFANNQQWWTSSVLGIIKKIRDFDFISSNDTLEIVIDCRQSICLGLLSDGNGDSETIKNNLKQVEQDIVKWRTQGTVIEDIDFDMALERAYIAAKDPTLRKDAFHAIVQLIAISDSRSSDQTDLDPVPYSEWKLYRNKLKSSLKREVEQIFLGTVKLEIRSARKNPIVALADQICGIRKQDFLDSLTDSPDLSKKAFAIQANIQNLTYGQNVDEYIKDGNYLEACDILLSQILSGRYDKKNVLDVVLDEASQDIVCEIWRKIFNACEIALNNRGEDGNAINHVAQIIPVLNKHEKEIPNLNIKVHYLKIYREWSAHSGEITDFTPLNLEEVLSHKDCEFSRDTERWSFYVEASAIQAQIYFNAYNFECVEIENLVKTQEQLASIEYPFGTTDERHVDENAAMLYGTIGQAAAFSGNLEKAVLYLDRDYRFASSKTISMPASYLSVVYHRQKNLEKATEWFEKECGTKFVEFGSKMTKDTDQWFILNYFRIYALSLENGVDQLPEFPAKDLWERSGWYPWPLLQKWAAYSMVRLGRRSEAVDLLQSAYRNLSVAPGFTVRTLALSPMAMLIQLSRKRDQDDLTRYQLTFRSNLESLCKESTSFAKYVKEHPIITDVAEGKNSLWDAAMILPFNYS